jgi:2-polyprenyl-6-methoxyphenol hydroxylase-like FAD-dependent oxidoreductase
MRDTDFDAIVVGARCAGSPTAMLLARKGYRVLVVDRARFPSDTISTHVLHPPTVAALARFGLRDRLVATGCPPIDTYAFHLGPFAITGSPGTADSPVAYAPRRTVLDKLLVDAAAEAGAELREGFSVDEIIVADGRVTGIRGRDADGRPVVVRARVVIGADGRSSLVARAVGAATYHERPPLQAAYYAYWSGLPMDGRFETYLGDRTGFAALPTHDGLTCVIGGWSYDQFEARKRDLEGNYLALLDAAPPFAARIRPPRRETRLFGAATPNFFRAPSGPGWALVGDAGYIKDPITAQGIADAFHDAELLAEALDQAWTGASPEAVALAGYQVKRDARVMPMYELTCQLATLEPPPPEMQQLLAAMQGDREAMDGFCRVNAGVTSPAEFFAPDSVGRIVARAEARRAAAG